MRRLLAAICVSAVLTLSTGAAASADYTTAYGNTYTSAQAAQLCAAMRPSLAATKPYCH